MIHRPLAIIGNLIILYAVDLNPLKVVLAYLGLFIWYLAWRIHVTEKILEDEI